LAHLADCARMAAASDAGAADAAKGIPASPTRPTANHERFLNWIIDAFP
jgi:hypothetical protein